MSIKARIQQYRVDALDWIYDHTDMVALGLLGAWSVFCFILGAWIF